MADGVVVLASASLSLAANLGSCPRGIPVGDVPPVCDELVKRRGKF